MAEEFDLIITGGRIVASGEVIPATVVVREGHVAGVLEPTEHPPARDHVNAVGLHVLPGCIDTHVHLRDPGRPEREDFVSGTSAAAAGGITTIIEMPISEPPVNSGEILARRAEEVQPRALVDYALYGAVGYENPDQVTAMAEAGAVAFKTFLHAPIPGREHEFVGLTCTDEGVLREIMAATAETGLLHCFHCENNAMLERLEEKLRARGRTDGVAHAESRPPVVEDAAVAELLAIAAEAGGRVQVVHMSSPLAAQLVTEAKVRGIRVTAETCPQYLFLTDDALREHGPYAKCNPALRSAEMVEEFWDCLRGGSIDVVGSDHSPFLDAEKARGLEDIFLAPAGLPGLEPMLPLMLDAVNEGRLSLPAVARLMSERAAELFGLSAKGSLKPGADADLVLVDMNAEWTFDSDRSFSKAGGNMRAYDGRRLKGRVVSTFVRGELVFHEGEIAASPGHGRFLRPMPVKERAIG
jgi:allantoinase